ncbi:Na+/H+ antiporter subunit E [Georgenia sunbinii]|uniref:Na+/H+ antiporter subunit E n=1 Tax=Georgenia sunbinii TaxID=3117728 RepID=UPI002F25EBF7
MRYVRWLGHALWFTPYFLFEIVKANVTVGADIITPGTRMSAGFIEIPLRCRTPFEIMMIANMITLTPGTVTVAVDAESPTVWVHSLYITTPDDFRADVHAMEQRLLAATRLDGAPSKIPQVGAWKRVTNR